MKRQIFSAGLMFCIAALAWAMPSPRDGFEPDVDNTVRAIAVDARGGILIGGDFKTVCIGYGDSCIFKLNNDGRPDFTFGWATANDSVLAIAVQSNGKIIIGGRFTEYNHVSKKYIARLMPNGAIDSTFRNAATNGWVNSIAVQRDGRIVIGGTFTSVNSVARNRIARLNADGSLDLAFNPGAGANSGVNAVAIQDDGRIVVGGFFTTMDGVGRNRIARLGANGHLDPTFNPGTGASSGVSSVVIQPDGKILVGGWFTQFAGLPRNCVARLMPDGTPDMNFRTGSGPNSYVAALAQQPDGKIVIGGAFTKVNGIASNRLARLNLNGTLDTGFGDTSCTAPVLALGLEGDGGIVMGGEFTKVQGKTRNHMARVNPAGALDATFNVLDNPGWDQLGFRIYTIAMQADERILPGGVRLYKERASDGLAVKRLNAFGLIDPKFDVISDVDRGLDSVIVQADGRILIGGNFVKLNGYPANYIGRVLPDSRPDTSFNSQSSGTLATMTKLLPYNQIIMSTSVPGRGSRLVKLNPNGSIDMGFADRHVTPYDVAINFAVQTDGKILISGSYPVTGGGRIFQLERLNANGTPDPSFTWVQTDEYVTAIALEPDGRILIGGGFRNVNGAARRGLARINQDGTLDMNFNPTAMGERGSVFNIAVQANGKILVIGNFSDFIGGYGGTVIRFDANGSLDGSFNTGGLKFDSYAHDILLQSDGKVVACGEFKTVNGLQRHGMVRLTNSDLATQKLEVSADARVITWQLGGAFPWLSMAKFETSGDGRNWTLIGYAKPVAGVGYRLASSSAMVAPGAFVRATGWQTGASESTSVMRSELWFTPPIARIQ
ncbi:hypothetical protein LLG95_04285 [bacterium]|nr:hypothetical protein [bacterium]